MSVTLGMMVTAGIVLMLYTVLYGDNPVSRTAQAIYMGVQAAYLLITNLDFFWRKGVVRFQTPGNFHYIIPVILGLLIFARLHEKTRALYRYPMAILVGSMLGVSIRTTVFSQILDQVAGNFPPASPLVGVPAGTALNNIIIIGGSIFALVFFVFSHEFTGPERYVHRLGRVFLLAAFGGTYGNTVSYRYELMAGTFISNLLAPAELLPYTMAFIVIIAIVLVVSFKTGLAEWH
ncbi:MAG: hypothetical protein PVJ38_02440 [Candidatus Bathyarchaeota archaeon]|jgi:hypothetical protein